LKNFAKDLSRLRKPKHNQALAEWNNNTGWAKEVREGLEKAVEEQKSWFAIPALEPEQIKVLEDEGFTVGSDHSHHIIRLYYLEAKS
jgi:hypothetical protein